MTLGTEEHENLPREAAAAWMLVVNTRGIPLYWIAKDGRRRDPSDEPPRSEWHPDVKCESLQKQAPAELPEVLFQNTQPTKADTFVYKNQPFSDMLDVGLVPSAFLPSRPRHFFQPRPKVVKHKSTPAEFARKANRVAQRQARAITRKSR